MLFLEPYYGGSHRAFADGLREHSQHRVELHTLPARFWKWRMRGAALHFAAQVSHPERFDVLMVSSLLSLADLRALWGTRCPPAVVYFHENQLSYPVPEGTRPDVHFGFTDITTALAAERLLFNSEFHRTAFLEVLPSFLRQMPDYVPRWVPELLADRGRVLHPGCELPPPAPSEAGSEGDAALPPLIVWNHRWEFDKRPEAFFAAVRTVSDSGVPLRVALLGENFQVVPRAFEEACAWLGDRIVRYGYVTDREQYWRLLRAGRVAVSTASQENFGMATVEAIWAGNHPLLPRRLAYPEVVPERFHAACLYDDDDELAERLAATLLSPAAAPSGLADAMQHYSWRVQAPAYDRVLEEVAAGG